LDINPFILIGKEAYAVDARIVVKPSSKKAPWHMTISCYPPQYETNFVAKNQRELFIRPIKPEDANLLIDFFLSLSTETLYQRFLQHLTSLEPDILARYTQIDYDRDLALVALDLKSDKPVMAGVARYFGHPDGEAAEMAIVIADQWQGQSIGGKLMELVIQAASKQGIKKLWGECLKENDSMIQLAKDMGAQIQPINNGSRLKIVIELPGNISQQSSRN